MVTVGVAKSTTTPTQMMNPSIISSGSTQVITHFWA